MVGLVGHSKGATDALLYASTFGDIPRQGRARARGSFRGRCLAAGGCTDVLQCVGAGTGAACPAPGLVQTSVVGTKAGSNLSRAPAPAEYKRV